MRDIYEGAERVLIWLGEYTGDASLAFEGIQRVSSHFSEGGSLSMIGLWEIINNQQANALDIS